MADPTFGVARQYFAVSDIVAYEEGEGKYTREEVFAYEAFNPGDVLEVIADSYNAGTTVRKVTAAANARYIALYPVLTPQIGHTVAVLANGPAGVKCDTSGTGNLNFNGVSAATAITALETYSIKFLRNG